VKNRLNKFNGLDRQKMNVGEIVTCWKSKFEGLGDRQESRITLFIPSRKEESPFRGLPGEVGRT
jgi:hypothetical protein